MNNKPKVPDAASHLQLFLKLAQDNKPYTFVRFSDGEVEILKNHNVSIVQGATEYRGRTFATTFPSFDQKSFNPKFDQKLRKDLLAAALFTEKGYYKGIPARHNDMIEDRDFMLRLNGGPSESITFSDLFMNSNYLFCKSIFFPSLLNYFSNLAVIGNVRCVLSGPLSHGNLIKIPDNFFGQYEKILKDTYQEIESLPIGTLVLSSASSLSNTLGHQLRLTRPDLTFIDIGTTLNNWLTLRSNTRAYHFLENPRGISKRYKAIRFRFSKGYKLSW